MKIFKKTKSFCSVCKKVVDADIFEQDGGIFMEKKCPEHGAIKTRVAKYAWYYKGLNEYYDKLHSLNSFEEQNSRIYTSSVTSKCQLNCNICFSDVGKNDAEDISLDFFKEKLEKIKGRRIEVQISGGEPTVRDDLPELLKIISNSGNSAGIFTNGVKISNDLNYLKKLKTNGLKVVYLWMDAVKNPEVYRKMRGEDFTSLKTRALENLKKAKIKTRIFFVVARGVNEREVSDMLDFVGKNNFIEAIHIHSYKYLGKCGFSPSCEFTVDELVEVIAEQSRGSFSLEDCYNFQKINYAISAIHNEPRCYLIQTMIVPRFGDKKINDEFNFKKFLKILAEFEKIWPENKKKARLYFNLKCLPILLRNPKLASLYFNNKKAKFNWGSKFYYSMLITGGAQISNHDINESFLRCSNRSINLDPENNIPRCQELIGNYAKKII